MIVRFFEWDRLRKVEDTSSDSNNIKRGDQVVVEHEWGTFLAKVLRTDQDCQCSGNCTEEEEVAGRVIRVVGEADLSNSQSHQEKELEIIEVVKERARQLEVPMKVVDARISLEGSCVVISFVADGRVDFRQLVKELSVKFGKSIRFQQIGSRDEARRRGGYGICGREVCCKKFSGSLKSISTDLARCQLISHRGSDRLSGICGRLMCCLAYEADQYTEMLKEFPERGSRIIWEDRRGVIGDLQVLSGKVRIDFEDRTSLSVTPEELKKKAKFVKD
jgi:cell fate regulator YaaT (PSP1 superfamily)